MIRSATAVAIAALLASALFHGAVQITAAGDRTTFRGCVIERNPESIVLHTSADELVTIDTTWLSPEMLAAALADCVTVSALAVDGRFVAESIEAGDEPNEVNSVTNETTADREQRHQERERRERDDKGDKKSH